MDKIIYQDIINVLFNNLGNRLKAIILFGSRARGYFKPDSDHDLYLIIENLPKNLIERQRLIRTLINEIPLRINTISKTPEEILCNLTPLMLDLSVDGICLYGSQYFEPLREKVLKSLKNSGLKRKIFGKGMYWEFEKIPKKEWSLDWDGFHEF